MYLQGIDCLTSCPGQRIWWETEGWKIHKGAHVPVPILASQNSQCVKQSILFGMASFDQLKEGTRQNVFAWSEAGANDLPTLVRCLDRLEYNVNSRDSSINMLLVFEEPSVFVQPTRKGKERKERCTASFNHWYFSICPFPSVTTLPLFLSWCYCKKTKKKQKNKQKNVTGPYLTSLYPKQKKHTHFLWHSANFRSRKKQINIWQQCLKI